MKEQLFGASSRIYYVIDDKLEVAYYARGKEKYRRIREASTQAWEDTIELKCDDDVFWMVVVCLERRDRYAAF